MKTCIFHPYKFNGVVGGTDIYVRNLINFSMKVNLEIFLVFPDIEESEFELDGLQCFGIKMYIEDSFKSIEGGIISSGIIKYKEILINNKPDIVHFHGFGKVFIPYLELLNELKIKSILTIHLSSFSCSITSLLENGKSNCEGIVQIKKCSNCIVGNKTGSEKLQKIYKYIYPPFGSIFNFFHPYSKFAIETSVKRQISMFEKVNNNIDQIIVLNDWYKEILLKNNFSEGKLKVIPTTIKPLIKNKTFDNQLFKIVFFGRINKSKGVLLLLDALRLHKQKKRIEIKLFGTLENDNTVLKQISDLNKEAISIEFCGQISHEQVKIEMTKASLVCVPSIDAEMCPLTILEAQSLGIPVLGANHTGIKDLIEDGETGLLFETNNHIELYKKLKLVANDSTILEKINKNLQKNSSTQDHFLKNYDLYNELIKKND